MRVEKIERSKRERGRVLVRLEGGDLLRITEDELLRFNLYAGLDITAETVVELQRHAARSETRLRAARIVSSRALSRRELTERLLGKGASEEDAEAAADWLEDIGALDDLAYAKTVVRHYSAGGYGAAKIRDELRRRGVARELWDEALSDAPETGETIARVIAAKSKGRPLDEKEYKKLSGALLRRGFAWRDVKAALRSLGAEIEAE